MTGKTETEETARKPEKIEDSAPHQIPKQVPDPVTGDIVRTAALACFGSGPRADALERMVRTCINLGGIAISETAFPENKRAVFERILRELAPIADVSLQMTGEGTTEGATKDGQVGKQD